MSDTPNQQPPYPPLPHPAPPLHYDEAGNPFFQDITGRLVPYFGQFPVYPPGLPPHGPFMSHDNTRDGPNSPISRAYMVTSVSSEDQALRAAQSSGSAVPSSRHTNVIDPVLAGLPPLPDSDDDDLIDGPTIAKAQGRALVNKAAGSRQKSKGKQCANLPSNKGKERASAPEGSRKRKELPLSSDEDEPEAKRGRPRGAGNYHMDDVMKLLDLIEAERPLGQRGWQAVHKNYTKWAHKANRPDRTVKSLETKYRQLVKTTKPTGDGYCPLDVKRAHRIEELIKERACTRDLDDSDYGGDVVPKNAAYKTDNEEDEEDNDIEIVEMPSVKQEIHEAIVRRPDPLATVTRRKNRPNGMELVTKLMDAFDPAAVRARDAERADRSLQNTQFLTLSQQLRDAQATIEGLRGQVSDLQSQLHNSERARDRSDIKLEVLELSRGRQRPPNWSHRAGRARCSKSDKQGMERHKGHTRVIERFPEGGEATWWVTDPSSTGSSDNDKENTPPRPVASSSRHYHRRRHRHSKSHHRTNPRRRSNSRDTYDRFLGSICPPSPFRSAMCSLNNMLEPPHFTASAGSMAEGSQTQGKETSVEEQETFANEQLMDTNKGKKL